jgi:hypothetical protein
MSQGRNADGTAVVCGNMREWSEKMYGGCYSLRAFFAVLLVRRAVALQTIEFAGISQQNTRAYWIAQGKP